MTKKGKFIVLEGADGSGKATQQKLLIDRIKKELKTKVFKVDFPQYEKSFFGGLAGRLLAGEFGNLYDIDPHLSSLPFAGDRWLASSKIRKYLKKGIVVSNRYALSNMAHQTARLAISQREKFISFLTEMEYGVYKIPREDLNIFLNVPADIGQSLLEKKGSRNYIGGRKKDVYEADVEYQKKCIEMYKYLAKKFKDRIAIVECCAKNGRLKTAREIHKLVWDRAKNFF